MKTNPNKRHRKSIRLKDYDYNRPGAYFVTVCTSKKECFWGNIENAKMILSEFGKIVQQEWQQSEQLRSEIELDVFQIMPNHFHAIVYIVSDAVGRPAGRPYVRIDPI